MGQSGSPNSMWAFYKSGSEGKIASGSESNKEQKWELLVLKNSIAERQRNTLMSSLTEKWAKVKSKWPFSRQLSCLQQKFWKKGCKRCLGSSGPTKRQGTECSCWITKKWVVEIRWKPLQAIFIGLEVWNNNGRVDRDLNCMPSFEKGGKWECENVRNCSSRLVKWNCDTRERQTPCCRELVRLSQTQDSRQSEMVLLLTALEAFQPVPWSEWAALWVQARQTQGQKAPQAPPRLLGLCF